MYDSEEEKPMHRRLGRSVAAAVCTALFAGAFMSAAPVRAQTCFCLLPDRACHPVQKEYVAPDGHILGYTAYRQSRLRSRTAIIYLHGISSHADWFQTAGHLLSLQGYDVFCLDRRGSGINRENRGLPSGHLEDYRELFDDISAFIDTIRPEYDRLVLVGMSWGGKLALAYSLKHDREIDDLILITPGVCPLVDAGFFKKLHVIASVLFSPMNGFRVPIEDHMFTRDPNLLDCIGSDELRLKTVTAQFFMQNRKLDRYIEAHIHTVTHPVLLFLAGGDVIIDNDCTIEMLGRTQASSMRIITYEQERHSLQIEAPERLVLDMHAWLQPHAAVPAKTFEEDQ